ncbi:MAG TPA: M14 family zinc carboxypeptidase [Phycisphaerae bacterium]|nr:M14 family zinc carboxypeptidase [Phycisphaerae bacterium]
MVRARTALITVGLLVWARPLPAQERLALDARPIDNVASQTETYAGHKVVRAEVRTPADLEVILSITPDPWTDYPGVWSFPFRVPPERMVDLDASGIPYEILIDDLGPVARQHLERPATRGTWDAYMTLAEILSVLNDLATSRPDLCEVTSFGTSIDGRQLWALHITGSAAAPKPAVVYNALMHCREWLTAPVVLYLADHLVNNYDSDPAIAYLVDNVDIYLAPCVNPDGYVYTWTSQRYWRKNRRSNGDGTWGVDLNRNWGYEWGYDDIGSSPVTSSETYRGPFAFSEPETTWLSNFILSRPGLLAYMDYHTYGQKLMWPWGYDYLGGPDEPDGTTFQTLGDAMQALIEGVHGVSYAAGPLAETIYLANGCSVDWAYGEAGAAAFTIELRPAGGGLPAFNPPPTEILPTCQENLPAILHLTEWAADQIGTSISLPNGVPEVLTPYTPEVIDVQIDSFFESAVPGSATLHYRYDGGGYQTAPLTYVGGSLYRATLPGAACDDTPEYYFSVEGSKTGVTYEPANAPAERYTAPVGTLVNTFRDNFETDTGWTVVDSPELTDGSWTRGVPVGGGDRGDPPTDYDGSGRCYLTDNVDGDSDVEDGITWLISPTIDLTDGNAIVRYAVWYTNNTNSNPAEDVFKIYVSNDNGSNWTPAETIGPVTSAGWTKHSFAVGNFVVPNDQVRVRFEASDLGGKSLVEAGVDAFGVDHVECALVAGDADEDGDVDADDYAYLWDCLGGPDQPIPGTCTVPPGVFDFDADADVDLDDFGEFQVVFESY